MSDKKSRREALELFRLKARPMLDAVIGMADHMESVEALDQAAKEAESRRATADADVATARAEIARMEIERDAIVGRAKEDAAALMDATRAKAKEFAASVDRKAAALMDQARADAAAVDNATARAREIADGDAEVRRQTAEAERAEIARLVAEHSELIEKIEEARALVRGLMGSNHAAGAEPVAVERSA